MNDMAQQIADRKYTPCEPERNAAYIIPISCRNNSDLQCKGYMVATHDPNKVLNPRRKRVFKKIEQAIRLCDRWREALTTDPNWIPATKSEFCS